MSEKSQLNEMLVWILNKIEASDNVLNELKLVFSQLNQILLSHAASIKSFEAHLLVVSAQMHNPTRGNDHTCMAITTKSSNPFESSMGSDTFYFGKLRM